MTDRELLELAAKAAGWKAEKWIDAGCVEDSDGELSWPSYMATRNESGYLFQWNPLTDDGDALRLAVNLGMNVWCDPASVCMAEVIKHCLPRCSEPSKPDPYTATRRAIVRAAAEIGKGMKP